MKLIALLLEFLREEEGQERIEYALLGPVLLVCVAAPRATGSQVDVTVASGRNSRTTAAANT